MTSLQKNTLHKLIELFVISGLHVKRILHTMRDWSLRGRHKALSQSIKYPKNLQVEVTNLCNANCIFCGYQYQERPKKRISFETFKMTVDQYASLGGGTLGITPVVGDPLLDRELAAKIAYARSVKNIVDIQITTNAILLTQKLFEELVASGLTHIVVSMSGFNRSEYKRIYRNDAYTKVTTNLEAVAKSSLFRNCKVTISIRTDHIIQWARHDYWKLKRLGYRMSKAVFYDNWSGRIKDLPGVMFIRPNRTKKHPCSMLYAGPAVLVDGTITACGCRDVNGDSELVLGNIHKHRLRDIWEDGTMDRLRNRFRQGDPPTICRDCRHYNPMPFVSGGKS